jgi:hypothetical protein
MVALYYGDKFKWFIGIVKKISPDRSRVKVRIYGIHRMDDEQRLSNEDLPWAAVVYPVTGGQNGSGNFSHDLQPETWVVGFFADGKDCREPIVTGVFNGGENSTSYYGTNDTQGFDGSQSTPAPDGSTPADVGVEPSNIPGGSRAEKAYNFFRERLEKSGISGDPHIVAATIVGFLQHESGQNLDPTILNTGGSSAYGIAQWLGGRRDNLFRRWGIPNPGRSTFARRGAYQGGPNFEQQLQFVWEEFKSGDGGNSWSYLAAARTFRDAGIGMIRYERNEAWQRINGKHIVNTNHPNFTAGVKNAERNANQFKYTGSAAPTPSNPAGTQ